MPKIKDSEGRIDENSGYTRLFGNSRLGHLLSRIQATVIRSGNELEKVLHQKTPNELIINFEEVLSGQLGLLPYQVVFSPSIPKSGDTPGETGDILIVYRDEKRALIIEVKDGDTFDTKKASGELASLQRFAAWFHEKTGFPTEYKFCSFNQENKEAIIIGAKGRFNESHIMTGRELCDILQINYELLREERRKEQPENLNFFLTELLNIPEILRIIKEKLGMKNGN